MSPTLRRTLEAVLLAMSLAAPLLPGAAAVALLLFVAGGWLALQPPRREALLAGVGWAVALAALAIAWGTGLDRPAPRPVPVEEIRSAYGALWHDLTAEAERAAEKLTRPPRGSEGILAAFRTLGEETEDAPESRRTLLLVDPDGSAVAWAGEGLVHDLRPETIPRDGVGYLASFSAVTTMAVQPLGPGRRPWRVVAARSFSTDRLPFGDVRRRRDLRWSLVGSSSGTPPGTVAITVEGRPTLVVEATPRKGAGAPPLRLPFERLAWGGLAFALLGLAVLRGVGIALASPGAGRGLEALVPALVGGAALGLAATLSPVILGIALAGVALAVGGVLGRRRWKTGAGRAAFGAAAVALVVLASWGYQRWRGPADLSSGLLADPGSFALRLAAFGAVFGLLAWTSRRRRSEEGREAEGDGWGWLAVLALAAGGALVDRPAAALFLLLCGGAATGLWLYRRPALRRPTTVAALALIATLAAAGAWETAYRGVVRGRLETQVLPLMAPATQREVGRFGAGLEDFFEGRDLARLVPRSLEGLERQDLAFVLWKGSPLARRNALSALVVEPYEGGRSIFSFGLPLDERGELDRSPERWDQLRLPVWEDSLITGEAELFYRGRPWALARYWLLLRPGFRIEGERPFEEMEARLLAGEASADRPVAGLPSPVVYALYSPSGRALVSPWDETPPLPPQLEKPTAGIPEVATPRGRAWAFSRRAADGTEVLYLPVLGPLAALERVATQAVSVLAALALLVLAATLLALPRPAFRQLLGRSLRSYSQRLIIVYTLLLLIPLLLLNILLVATAGERLEREQRGAGEAALNSAQRVLGDYVLYLEPGFSLDTALDDELLIWLSRVVHHDVNLYWGSEVYASSKPELFTAGLLPKRIPGEIYARLALLGYDLSSRTNRAGEATYLELYAPLRVPGVPVGNERLFLSVPLLAQQEEVARELAALRRQAVVATSALFALLIAVGLRLARSFTKPLMELVEGTRRIAAGATSLELAPSELELAALVEAVDEMARRIAEGRVRVLREKQVVERIVENITSGVVSLDRQRRVLLRNRVAEELLGVEVGERLDEALACQERLAPVAAFLAASGGEVRQETVRLHQDAGEEREWSLVWVAVPGSGEPSALLVVEDATEVLHHQRLAAWAEMARIIAHEIKNPLTPIRLNAEHLQQVWSSDRGHFDVVFERCTRNIVAQVDELQQIASEFSTYSSILHLERRQGNLVEAMEELVEPYRSAPSRGVAVELVAEGAPIAVRFDRKLLGRAVRNLLENALRASPAGGRVTLRVGTAGDRAQIAVTDSGPGVPPDVLPRIFDPYFSTHDSGTGLGLPIARRIAEEHGGGIVARNLASGGLEVTITIPLK